ncbi:hypothetical protein TIFTF001_027520 [Ficus carica]|uniref:Uncharacterized protein n=1 Tax=Ficus carica TaxID=3494 RepID=A0AA88DNJ2_FICCA|nr:hypothetical protein TIFTF001_027520 [Ficus carica]
MLTSHPLLRYETKIIKGNTALHIAKTDLLIRYAETLAVEEATISMSARALQAYWPSMDLSSWC